MEQPSGNQLSNLRASVLGANDGVVSTAGLIMGMAGANASKETIVMAGIAGLVAGAISMGAGEFVSVSSQRDSEKSLVSRHRHHVTTVHDDSDFDELVSIYIAKGISKKTARAMVTELENNQKLNIEIFKELGVDPDDLVNPWQATIASATSFTFGASIPLLAAYLSPITLIMPITFGAVLASLILTGTISARIGKANRTRASLRIILWGVGAMIITYVIGLIFHTI